MKHTNINNEDYKFLSNSLNNLKEMADYINEFKRETENKEKLEILKSNLIGNFEVINYLIIQILIFQKKI